MPQQACCGRRTTDTCNVILGLLEHIAGPSCQRLSPAGVFPVIPFQLRIFSSLGQAPGARRSFTDHGVLLDKGILASSISYLIFHS